ncbi:MAG: hypothetical protein PHO27_11855 [Sulfuricurvum sp.]|nr:hypothetical protein [Sulfuricurvum sp.]
MESKITDAHSHSVVTVTGIVKTIAETVILKEQIGTLLQRDPQKKIVIDFIDTFVIPSALIGTLQKFILSDNAQISVIARVPQLYELLDNLCLTTQFNVIQKMG